MLTLVKPTLEELSFRQQLLADEATMTYNHSWGGTIDFPRERWQEWYADWVEAPQKCFYRYLYVKELDAYVGEIAYHYDAEYQKYMANVIVMDRYRGYGYGREGLQLLCHAAKEHGLPGLCDDIAPDNSAIRLFIQQGFVELWRNDVCIMLEKKFGGACRGG